MSLVGRILVVAAVAAGIAAHAASGATPNEAKRAGGPARARVAPPSEPGVRLALYVRIQDALTGKPIPGATLFVYQTDDAGYYDRDEDGRERGPRTSRLHATAHADTAGVIVFDTIVPGSYPGAGIFRHIHYVLTAEGYARQEKEIILDEAPWPSREQRRWAERNGDIVTRRVKGDGGQFEIRVTLNLKRPEPMDRTGQKW